jgi:hypothetical protein
MNKSEVIDAKVRPLAIRDETELAERDLFPGMSPAQRAEQMVDLAKVFVGLARERDAEAKRLKRAPLIVEMLDKKTGRKSEHLTIGLWQVLGALLPRAVTAIPEWTKPIEGGYEARSVVQTLDGRIIGAAEHQCTREEGFWKYQTDAAIRSMAQTRSQVKAYAGALRFLVVLAGFSGTPAEEMPSKGSSSPPEPKPPRPTAAPEPTELADARAIGAYEVVRYAANREIPDRHRHEIAAAFFGQPSTAELPLEGKPLTVDELRKLYKLLTRYVNDRSKDQGTGTEINDFDGWLALQLAREKEDA